jgi:lipoyl(octanoyl) transferase
MTLQVRWLGKIGYAEALAEQERLVAARRAGAVPDTLLLLEHPPVVTMGRSGDAHNLLLPAEELERRGVELHDVGRGGDVTYHGPGQLVGYPVVQLPQTRRDAHRYLRDLEEALIRTAAAYGIAAGRVAGLTGVWVGDGKLAAIGVRLSSGWITSHGFALNVATDLTGFGLIVPCGIRDRGVTSLEALLGHAPPLREVAARVALEVAAVLELSPSLSEKADERLSWEDLSVGDA